MGQFLEYHQKSVGGNSHLAPSCGRILVAECSESETQTDEARWHVERMVEVGLHLLLQSFFERFSPFFEPKSPFSNRNQPKIGLYLNGRGKNWNSLV